MSCIPSIQPRLTRKQMREAKKQRLKYSSPPMRPSLLRRLVLLSTNDSPLIRARAAADYKLPLEMQLLLATDAEPFVRAELARNPFIHWATYNALMADESEYVRAHLVLNHNCPYTVAFSIWQTDTSERVRSFADYSMKLHETDLVA